MRETHSMLLESYASVPAALTKALIDASASQGQDAPEKGRRVDRSMQTTSHLVATIAA